MSALFDDGAAADGPAGAGVQTLPVADLSPSPFQPRQHFDPEKIAELAASIKTQGILQPILVRAASPGVKTPYEIVAGERRWRAAQQARVHDVPVVIRELANVDAAEIALLENVQREDLSPFEEAEGYRGLMAQFGYSQTDVAERVGKSRAHVANALRLLAMPDGLRTMVEKGELSAGHARALLSLENPLPLARQAAAENWSVRRLEQAVRDLSSGAGATGTATDRAHRAPWIRILTSAKLKSRHPVTSASGSKSAVPPPGGTSGSVTLRWSSWSWCSPGWPGNSPSCRTEFAEKIARSAPDQALILWQNPYNSP
ncbi:MAG: ParB/RepB/Spo0J family partition protein [Alphaproteobacteria bacterium]